MKKLLLACTLVLGFCALGQVADAGPYYRHGYGHRYHRGAYFRPYYGGYGYYGIRPVFVGGFYYPPPPAYYYPPSPPPYYEGRIEREDVQPRPSVTYDNSK